MKRLTLVCLLMVAVALLWGSPVLASGSKAKPVTGASYYWYDGARKRTIHLDPELIAQFDGERTPAKAAPPAPGLEAAGEARGGVRFWKAGAGSAEDSISASAKAARASGGKFSPVFNNRGGRGRRALPGGVIVTFDSAMSDEACAAWIAAKGLTVQRKLTQSRQIYVLDTPAGMKSLELANSLHESGEVESASPNWWTEVETK